MPVVPAFRRLGKEVHKSQASLGYTGKEFGGLWERGCPGKMAQCLKVLTAKLINGLRLIPRTNTVEGRNQLWGMGRGEGRKH